ncbi:MAG: O-antigen ligase family protein [Firmicutes bacterium]|nr:O-antigen ligase family protein [Dethiobacter sp.]MBS3888778.1 O-antigen ligase family protein [Bacillota bacterium]MBS4053899.1 O-antigen ligase family protein [Thermaerobacter sp.]
MPKTAKVTTQHTQRQAHKQTAPNMFAYKYFVAVFSLALLGVGAFLRGLYWPIEYWAAIFLCTVVGLLAFLLWPDLRTRGLTLSWPKFAALIFLGVLLLGLIRPVSTYHALQSVLFWASVLLVYLLWSAMPLDKAQLERIITGLVLAGAALATAGLAVYTGVYSYERWLVGGRLSAGFEYPNVAASWFLVTLLLALHRLIHSEKQPFTSVFYAIAAQHSLAALFFTYSRGGWLAAGACVALLIVVSLRQRALSTVLSLVWVGALGLLSIYVLLRLQSLQGFALFWALSLLVGLGTLALGRLRDRTVSRQAYLGVGLLVFAATGAIAYRSLPFLTERLQAVVARFSLEVMLQDGRLVFFRDAWRIFLQSPVFGHGGGAWRSLYHRVQSFLYGSARLHSDPFEILLEVGFVGFAAYLVFVGWHLIKGVRSSNRQHQALALASFALLLHSTIEALLGFPVLYYLLAVMLGILGADLPAAKIALPHLARLQLRRLFVPALLVMLVVSGIFWLAEAEDMWNIRAANLRGDAAAVRAGLERALKVNPYAFDRRMAYIGLLWRESPQEQALPSALAAALRFWPHDPRITNLFGHYYLGRQDFARAVDYFTQALEQQPMNIQNHEALALAHLFAAVDAAAEEADARAHLSNLESVHTNVSDIITRTDPAWLVQSTIPFVKTPVLTTTQGALLVMRGHVAQAVDVLSNPALAKNADSRETALVWLIRALELSGRHDEAQAILALEEGNAGFRAHLAHVSAATDRSD